MQLVAYGAQDIYLTGNPQITFFKVVYRRHTNFAMEAIPQTFDGSVGFGKTLVCTVPRNGDLVHRMYVKVVSSAAALVNTDWRSLIDNVELEIGGQRIDKQYYRWQAAWQALSYSAAQKDHVKVMTRQDASVASQTYYIPLDFWFCRNPGLALPLIALQYHEVKVRVQTASAATGMFLAASTSGTYANTTAATLSSMELLCDYIYLDTDERRRFAQVSHEYLIEQVQFTGAESLSSGTAVASKVTLNFNHPVKELIWVFNGTCKTVTEANFAFFTKCKLQLNGHDRFREETGDYFAHVQPFQHHTGQSTSTGPQMLQELTRSVAATGEATAAGPLHAPTRCSYYGKMALAEVTDVGFYCYSFGLRPEEHQPSGTCNFSRIDNAVLNLTHTNTVACDVHVFAHGYNVLRVMSGMGGLAYSN